MSDNPWHIKSRRTVYDNPWITVAHHEVLDPGGRDGIYGIVQFKNRATGVVPLAENGDTWLVGQYRLPLGKFSWELPEGGAPLQEDPLEGAKRELREEVGLVAARWEPLLRMDLSNSVTDEVAYVYLAEELTQHEAAPEPDEQLLVKRLPLSEALQMVEQGEITDAISVAGLLAVARLKKL
jgi:8-oxo-dGTP pyrophosphatase MutT (NUDIX family)